MATAPATSYRITAVVDGLEKVEALKQTIKLLANQSSPAADAVSQLRQQALELGRASNASTKDIRTAVDALKGLKDVVSLASDEYKILSGDIQNIGSRLDTATGSVVRHTQAHQRLGQIVNANSKAINNYFNNSALRQQDQLNQRIQQQMRTPTLALPAAGQSSFRGTVDSSGFGGGARRGTGAKESPFEMGRDYSSKQRYMGATRSDSEVAAAAGFLERDAAAAKNAASATNQYQTELEQLFASIRKYQGQQVANKNQQVAYSYKELSEEITRVTASSNGSLNSLRQQRQLWEQLYNSVEKTDPAYSKARANMQRLDKDINARSLGGMNRLERFGQTAGAVAASGVFGGPEGFLGAAIGSIGGPGGALGGGAIGAQIGMFRQQLGGFATYAADIQKLEIALKGVTRTQSEYEAAVRAAAAVTRDFNVPQLEATQGMTRLSAAVIGAGGKVADAEVVFRNVTAAIKATGGSSEDVQGAITALSQIFSKGKVSAEELQGQLGERLPGAVTMFAQATGRTLPQLQKDLEQGAVGLADLMKFVVGSAGLGQFEQGALRVSKSSADAGARLVVTWNQTKQAIGQALQPLGAEIQQLLTTLLQQLTPTLTALANGLAAVVGPLANSLNQLAIWTEALPQPLRDTAVAAAGAGIAIGGFALAAKGLAALGIAAAIKSVAASLAAAALQAKAFGVALLANPLGLTIAGVAALTVAAYNLNKPFREFVDSIPSRFAIFWQSLVNDGTAAINQVMRVWASLKSTVLAVIRDFESKWSATLQWFAATWQQIKNIAKQALGAIGIDASRLSRAIGGVAGQFSNIFNAAFRFIASNWRKTIENMINNSNPLFSIASRLGIANVGGAATKALFGDMPRPSGSPATIPPPPSADLSLTNFALPASTSGSRSGSSSSSDAAAKAADNLAAEQQRLNEAIEKERVDLYEATHRNAMDLLRERYEYEQELARRQRDNLVKLETGGARTAAAAYSAFLNEIIGLQNKVRDAASGVQSAALEQQVTAQRAAVTAANTAVESISSSRAGNFIVNQNDSTLQALAKTPSFIGAAGKCTRNVLEHAMENIGRRYNGRTRSQLMTDESVGISLGDGNDPRNAFIGLQKYGWAPLPGYGKPTTLRNSAGSAPANMLTAKEYEQLVAAGGVPSGALIYSTRHSNFNGGAPRSSGYDIAITKDGGRSHNNSQEVNRPLVYGSDTKWVAVFVPKESIQSRPTSTVPPAAGAQSIPAQPFPSVAADSSTTKPENAQLRRAVTQIGSADVASANVLAATSKLQLAREKLPEFINEAQIAFVADYTESLRSANQQLDDNVRLLGDQRKQQLAGVRQEIIDGEREKGAVILATSQGIEKLQRIITDNDETIAKLRAQPVAEQDQELIQRLEAASAGTKANIEFASQQLETYKTKVDEATASLIAFNDAMRVRQDSDVQGGFREAAVKYIESIGTIKEATTQLALDGFKGVEDAIVSLLTTGTANFKEFASNILKQTARIIIQQLFLRTIMQAIGAIGGGGKSLGSLASNLNQYAPVKENANGNAFARNGIQPFAKGGIVNNPTIFRYANGGSFRTGVMGEAGPEAIVPLKRGKDGKLGIAGGGNSTVVNVSVDASGGTQVQGNAGQGEQLGRVIAAAVQAELVKQKRPGGILAG